MAHLTEWAPEVDDVFAEAVEAIREDIKDGASFEHSLEHYADLFEIAENALRHEWELRNS